MTTQNNGGPWKLIGQTDSGVSWVCPADSEDICDGFATVWSNGKDKARLIAAAPTMLHELYAAAAQIEALGGDASTQRAAIAKATGDQP